MNQWWLSMGMIKIRMSCMFLCQSMTVNLYKIIHMSSEILSWPFSTVSMLSIIPKRKSPIFGFPARTLASREAGSRSIGTFSSHKHMVMNWMFHFINFEFLYELMTIRSIVKLDDCLWIYEILGFQIFECNIN